MKGKMKKRLIWRIFRLSSVKGVHRIPGNDKAIEIHLINLNYATPSNGEGGKRDEI